MRLDNYLVEKQYFDSRTKAKQSIERGEIFIDGKAIKKASFEIKLNVCCKVERICDDSFVSLGGFKLKKALDDFNFNVKDLNCVDIGASTGGFTDCLLQNGANKVYAVDLNDELLHYSLKNNEKVVPIIKNVKDLARKDFLDKLDLVVADLSFISITQVLPIISDIIDNKKALIILIKPQFETGEKIKFKNGIVRDKKMQLQACYNAIDCAIKYSLFPASFTVAPKNEDKNLEFLMLFVKNGECKLDKSQIIF